MKDATLGMATVIKQGCRYLIALIAKTKVSILLEKKTLKEALYYIIYSIYNVTLELSL